MTFDFKVIGSGPTGSYCAARLARSGYRVKLVDKAQFPRDKLCGGGLTLKSIMRIKALHTGFERAHIVDYINDFHVGSSTSDEKISFKWLPRWLGLVKRQEFDDWMRNKAIECGVEYTEEKYKGFRELLDSKFIVAADGYTSDLGELIHGKFSNNEVVVATEAYVPNETNEAFAAVILNETNDPDNAGYSWLFGRKDRVGVGTGVVRSYDKHMLRFRNKITEIAESRYGYEVSSNLYRNWVIPIFKYGRETNLDNNIVCIGDALGVADPIYAEGIAAGMISADILIDSFHNHGDFSTFHHDLYNHEYFSQMGWMHFLQQQANSNHVLAFRLLKEKGVIEGFLKFINWQQTPEKFVKWIQIHYPIYALKLAYSVWYNRGSEL